jgi:hypothetical protein
MSTGRKDAAVSRSVVLGIVRLFGGWSGNSRNSRFGGINSRLVLLREFGFKLLIYIGVFGAKTSLHGANRKKSG